MSSRFFINRFSLVYPILFNVFCGDVKLTQYFTISSDILIYPSAISPTYAILPQASGSKFGKSSTDTPQITFPSKIPSYNVKP